MAQHYSVVELKEAWRALSDRQRGAFFNATVYSDQKGWICTKCVTSLRGLGLIEATGRRLTPKGRQILSYARHI